LLSLVCGLRLICLQSSISLQMGKPCMIEQTEFFTKAGSFYKQPFAIYGVDVLLCAFASLRIISSEILELVSAGGSSRHLRQPPNPTLMKLLNDSITSWEEYWFAISDDSRFSRCSNVQTHLTHEQHGWIHAKPFSSDSMVLISDSS